MVSPEITAAEADALGVSLELLNLLVCPIDKAALRIDGTALICTSCQRRYPIDNGIPDMRVDDEP